MHMGQKIDSSGLELKRQAKNVEYNQAKNQKENDNLKDMEQNAEKNASLFIIPDKDVIASLKGQKLQDQLDAFRLAGAPLPVLMNDVKAVVDKKMLSTMLFISMRMINGPQLVLSM